MTEDYAEILALLARREQALRVELANVKETIECVRKANETRNKHIRLSSRGKKHFVLGHPARLARARTLYDRIVNGAITAAEFLEEMHTVQPKPRIKSVQSFYNWKAKGFDGLYPAEPIEDPNTDKEAD